MSPTPRIRRLFAGTLVAALGLALAPTTWSAPAPASADDSGEYLIGRGIADMTGEPGEVGMMGYGSGSQKTSGIHMRQYARSYIVEADGQRVLMVTLDSLTGTNAVRSEVLRRLAQTHPGRWNESNVMIGGNHTHATPGGVTDYALYNVTTMGFHSDTFNAQVEGILASIDAAEADLAPGTLSVGTAQLGDEAGVQRSMPAFENNPDDLRAQLPEGHDHTSVTLAFDRDGKTVGAINWYATHPTSLTADNTLISGDNKGYAQYLWEEAGGTNHRADEPAPMVASFMMSNGADISPNLDLEPGSGPTDDEYENARIIGERQYAAATAGLKEAAPVRGAVDSRITYIDMEDATAPARFTGTGKDERTCEAALGASFGAGSVEDGGGGPPFLHEGVGNNPFFEQLSQTQYWSNPALERCQAPKGTLFHVGALNAIQTKLPVQLLRIGDRWIAGLPGEVTGASGVRFRQAVADAVGTTPEKVMIQQTTNAYAHYFTTPEEYVSQQYEGGATAFGRWTTPALEGVLSDLGTAMTDGTEVPLGDRPERQPHVESAVGKVLYDVPGLRTYGDVLRQPTDVAVGETVSARFQGAHPNNDLRHHDTYLEVQKREGDAWVTVADDHDPSTIFRWERHLAAQSKVTIAWTPEADTAPGEYRLVYHGDAKDGVGRITGFTGTSAPFRVG